MQYHWTQINDDPRIEEARPYEECPRCGEHQLTIRRGRVRTGLITRTPVRELYCHYCHVSSGPVPGE